MNDDLRVEFERETGILSVTGSSDYKVDYLGKYSCFLESKIFDLGKENADCFLELVDLQKENERLEKNFLDYAQHNYNCEQRGFSGDNAICDCGLDDLLKDKE